MQMAATLMSALLAGLGAIAVFLPDTLIEMGRNFTTPKGLLAAAAVRVVFGALLITAASTSRAPNLLRVFGALILVAGLATPLLGPEYARGLQAAVSERGELIRVAGTVAIVLGCSFVWALSPRGGGRVLR